MFVRGDALRLPLASESVDLVLGSPPYVDARLYLEDGRDLGISRKPREWVDWMLRVTAEALRVSKGPVVWIAAGVTRDRTYWPACEGLMWRWWSEGWGEHGSGTYDEGSAYRPCYWHRVGIPGSGGDQWMRADIEYCMAFKRPGPLPWSDNTACGAPPKWAPGGKMTSRLKNGKRCHERNWKLGQVNDSRQHYTEPDIANPGNMIHTEVGGGQMGSSLAHENEAPYPEALAEFFVSSLCPPDGIVLDPFSGSGTTVTATTKLGRRGIGTDLRQSQCRLGQRRLRGVTPGFAFA